MIRTLAILITGMSLVAGCAAIHGKYTPKSAVTYPATGPGPQSLPVLDQAPDGRRFEVIGEVTAQESVFSILPPSRDDIIQELSRHAAAAGGQALLNVRIGYWSRSGYTLAPTRTGSPTGKDIMPTEYHGKAAAADVIRFVD